MMSTSTLYIYERTNKKGKKVTTYSLTQNPALGTLVGTAYRLVAATHKILTDGETTASCIDTTEPEIWTEIDEPEAEQDAENE